MGTPADDILRLREFQDRGRAPPPPEEAPPFTIKATPFRWRDPALIPRREWLYDRRLCRGFISTTVSAGGIGKSSLELVEAVALATGRPLLGPAVPNRCRCWYFNLEDPLDEVERRVAAIVLHYGLDPQDLEDWLFLDSGRTSEIILAETTRAGTKLAQPVYDALAAEITEKRIDVVWLDPFVSAHRVPENDNGAIDAVAKGLNRIAEQSGCAFSLVHHVRKGTGQPGNTTVEDGRGAVALLAAARSARVLNGMTKEEAERAGVDNPRLYFRADNGKANLAPPPDRSDWFRLASVSLGNGPEGLLDLSDHVAVVEAWQWPDALADISVADLQRAQAAVQNGRWRENAQSSDWVGKPIAAALGIELDEAGKARVKKLLKTWIATGMFVVVEGTDEKRNKRSFVEVGEAA